MQADAGAPGLGAARNSPFAWRGSGATARSAAQPQGVEFNYVRPSRSCQPPESSNIFGRNVRRVHSGPESRAPSRSVARTLGHYRIGPCRVVRRDADRAAAKLAHGRAQRCSGWLRARWRRRRRRRSEGHRARGGPAVLDRRVVPASAAVRDGLGRGARGRSRSGRPVQCPVPGGRRRGRAGRRALALGEAT